MHCSRSHPVRKGSLCRCFNSYKTSGSEIALTFYFLSASMGYIPWFDESRDEINGRVMLEGVRDAAV